jgi:AraC family transcriptional regulator
MRTIGLTKGAAFGFSRMTQQVRATMDVEAQLIAPGAQVQLVRYDFAEPPESVLRLDDKIRVELCMSSRHRSARACFSDFWSRDRFERIGDVFAVPPTLDVQVRSDEDRALCSVVCLLDLAPVLAMFDRVPEFEERFFALCLDIRNENVRHLLLRLADELRHPGFASRILVESVATQLNIELLRYGTALPERSTQGALAPWQLRRIEERLIEVREAPTLHELAVLCGVSVRQLSRSFRLVRGCSVGTYVADRQIMHAKRLLAEGRGAGSVAETLGFACSSNFNAAFRRATGMTPGEYRHSLLQHRVAA